VRCRAGKVRRIVSPPTGNSTPGDPRHPHRHPTSKTPPATAPSPPAIHRTGNLLYYFYRGRSMSPIYRAATINSIEAVATVSGSAGGGRDESGKPYFYTNTPVSIGYWLTTKVSLPRTGTRTLRQSCGLMVSSLGRNRILWAVVHRRIRSSHISSRSRVPTKWRSAARIHSQ